MSHLGRAAQINTRSFIFISLMALLFLSFNSGMLSFMVFPKFADEALLALSVFTILIYGWKTRKIVFFLLIYLAYSSLNAILSPFSPNTIYALAQSLINIKVFLVAYAAIILLNDSSFQYKCVTRIFYIFSILFFVGLLFNIILGEAWNSYIFGQDSSYRYGFIRPTGYFGHYAPNSYFLAIFMIIVLMLHTGRGVFSERSQVKKLFAVSVIDFLMAFPLTVRKGLFILIPYSIHVISTLGRRNKIVVTLSFIIFFFSALYALQGTKIYEDTTSNLLNLFSDDHAYIRGLIFYRGIGLFQDFFPFGVGNGLFGTVFSATNTSVYTYLGFDISFITAEDGNLAGVYDSGISSFLAESGFFGLIIIIFIISDFYKINKRLLIAENYAVFKIITAFAIILSLTEPVWQNGFFTTFYTISLLYIHKVLPNKPIFRF